MPETAAVQSPKTSASPSSQSDQCLLTPSSLADKYQFIRKLGEGAQAKVFLARRLSNNQNVAIKQLNIDSVSNWKAYDLFHREAEVLSGLKIDGVASFYEAIECLNDTPPCSYLVQEYIEGASLAAMLNSGHRFSTDQVYDILIQMITILGQLQSQPVPVIHRDIKPSNIMLTPTNGSYKVTLIDFGAVANPQVQSGGSTVAGTYGYMPPEQLMGRPQPASDIYSLAAVAIELFSGVSPATLPTKDFRLIFEPEMQSQPTALVNTLRKMLEPDTKDRLSDLANLNRLFTNYKNGIFTHANEKTRVDKEFNQKLSEICDIGAPGNIDLWQQLPDEPIRDVPEIFSHLNELKSPEIDTGFHTPAQLWKILIPGIVCFACILLVGLVINTKSPPILAIVMMPAIALIILFSLIVAHNDGNKRIQFADDSNDTPALGSERQSESERNHVRMKAKLKDLIANGRKTIATIVSIEYLPANDQDCASDALFYAIYSEPKFRIQYKFNPPDDMRNEDLIHSCIVHTEPEHFYKVGDPLPILYRIKGSFFGEEVTSCPFPFSVNHSSADEVLDTRYAGAELDKYCQKVKVLFLKNDDEKILNHLIQTAKHTPLEFRKLIRNCVVESQDGRRFVIGLTRFFLNADKLMDTHPDCISYLVQQINEPRLRDEANAIIVSYLNRMKSGSGNLTVIKILMNAPYKHQMTDIWDCLYDLCERPEIRRRVGAEIGNQYEQFLTICPKLISATEAQQFEKARPRITFQPKYSRSKPAS